MRRGKFGVHRSGEPTPKSTKRRELLAKVRPFVRLGAEGGIKGNTLIARDEGDDARGVTIKLYSEETNGAVSIIEQPFEPGLLLPPHVHQNDVWLYILEGT